MRGRLGRAERGPAGSGALRGAGRAGGAGAGPGRGRAGALRAGLTPPSSQVRALQAAGAGVRVGSDQAEGDRAAREGEDVLHRLSPGAGRARGRLPGRLWPNASFAAAARERRPPVPASGCSGLLGALTGVVPLMAWAPGNGLEAEPCEGCSTRVVAERAGVCARAGRARPHGEGEAAFELCNAARELAQHWASWYCPLAYKVRVVVLSLPPESLYGFLK